MASPKQATKVLQGLGYTLAKTKSNGGQVWRLGNHTVCIPAKSEVSEGILRTARRQAERPAAVQTCAIPGCHRQATGWNNKCAEHWQAQCAGFPSGL